MNPYADSQYRGFIRHYRLGLYLRFRTERHIERLRAEMAATPANGFGRGGLRVQIKAVTKTLHRWDQSLADTEADGHAKGFEIADWQKAEPFWPVVGCQYAWEMMKPHAATGVAVTEIYWVNNACYVRSEGVTPCGEANGLTTVNSLDRFREACAPWYEASGTEKAAWLSEFYYRRAGDDGDELDDQSPSPE